MRCPMYLAELSRRGQRTGAPRFSARVVAPFALAFGPKGTKHNEAIVLKALFDRHIIRIESI